MKKVLKILAAVFAVILVFLAGFIAVLQFTEYNPEEVEKLEVSGSGVKTLKLGERISLLTFNIGYGALGAEQDFFMDGGKMVRPESKSEVERYLKGISSILAEEAPDIMFLQEIDIDAKRSYYIDEETYFSAGWQGNSVFAANFKCLYVPYPLPTIGKVLAGLVTYNQFDVSHAERIALPVSFSWPVRLCNLKRCLLIERTPIEGSDKELVLINLHLEAYDDGSGKAAQTKILMDILDQEYKKGNYVIAGGDFNQSFSTTDLSAYPLMDNSYFEAGIIDEKELPEGFSFQADSSIPSARLLDKPYQAEAADNQYYVIDGFILSDNIKAEHLETLDKGFLYSDHNPVRLEVVLE